LLKEKRKKFAEVDYLFVVFVFVQLLVPGWSVVGGLLSRAFFVFSFFPYFRCLFFSSSFTRPVGRTNWCAFFCGESIPLAVVCVFNVINHKLTFALFS